MTCVTLILYSSHLQNPSTTHPQYVFQGYARRYAQFSPTSQPSKDHHIIKTLVRATERKLTFTITVLWAQRSSATDAEKNIVYLTISVPDVPPKSLKLDLKPTGLSFTGTSETKKTTYHLVLDFFAEIDVENSKTHHTPANIQLLLRKKEMKEEYWPRLLKDAAKVHYLRTDFDKVRSMTHPGSSHIQG